MKMSAKDMSQAKVEGSPSVVMAALQVEHFHPSGREQRPHPTKNSTDLRYSDMSQVGTC